MEEATICLREGSQGGILTLPERFPKAGLWRPRGATRRGEAGRRVGFRQRRISEQREHHSITDSWRTGTGRQLAAAAKRPSVSPETEGVLRRLKQPRTVRAALRRLKGPQSSKIESTPRGKKLFFQKLNTSTSF